MNLRLAVGAIILVLVACAALSSHQHKPFELIVDANPGAWPTNAAADDARLQALPHMLVAPCPLTPKNLPAMDERDA